MRTFEEFTRCIVQGLDLPARRIKRIQSEILAHLEEEYEHCLRDGLTPEVSRQTVLDRFGDDDAIRTFLGEVLRREQARHRRRRGMGAAVFATLAALCVGAWLQVFDDAVAGAEFVESLPMSVWYVLYTGGVFGGVLILAGVTSRVFGHSRWTAIAAWTILAIFHVLSIRIFGATPLRATYGVIEVGESQAHIAFDSGMMRLCITTICLLLAGALSLVLSRKRKACIMLLLLCFGLCVASAAMRTLSSSGYMFPWAIAFKWPKLLSVGIWALLTVILAGVIGRSLQERFCKTSGNQVPDETQEQTYASVG